MSHDYISSTEATKYNVPMPTTIDPRHCAMTEFRLTHKEPEHVTEERDAVTEAERGDWTKPIRVSEVAVKAPVASARKEQLPLFGAK